jgi:hypothetical protein
MFITLISAAGIIGGVWIYARHRAQKKADAAALADASKPVISPLAAGGRRK